LIVRRETQTDPSAIRAVHAAAFEAEELERAEPVEVRLVDDLRAEGHVVPGLSLVAVVDGAIVGLAAWAPSLAGRFRYAPPFERA
jgi:putative acetyltransferase